MLATRLVALAYGVALTAALARRPRHARASGPDRPEDVDRPYGRPIWFAESDLSVWRDLSPREKRIPVPLDPLENPTRVEPARFLVSYASFAAPLAGLVWLVSRARRS